MTQDDDWAKDALGRPEQWDLAVGPGLTATVVSRARKRRQRRGAVLTAVAVVVVAGGSAVGVAGGHGHSSPQPGALAPGTTTVSVVASSTPAASPTVSPVPSVPPVAAGSPIPWRSLPARDLPVQAVTVTPTEGPCSATALTVGTVSSTDNMERIELKNNGAACTLPTVASAGGTESDGTQRKLSFTSDSRQVPWTHLPAIAAHGTGYLAAAIHPCPDVNGQLPSYNHSVAVKTLVVALSTGQTLTVPGVEIIDQCGLDLVLSGVPDLAAGASAADKAKAATSVAGADPTDEFGQLRAQASPPQTLVRGNTYSFNVTVTNQASSAFSFSPCPNYTLRLVSTVYEHSWKYALDCSAVPGGVPAGGSVTFAMTVAVPADAATGAAKISWQLDHTAAVFAAEAVIS